MQRPGQRFEVLLVEDNPADAELTLYILKESKLCNHFNVVGDGVEAMAYLRKEGKFTGATRPDLVLLDLNMPRKSGREVLEEIKADEDLRTIPVVVLTTSDDEMDIIGAYKLNANCYISKPVDLDQFTKVLRVVEDFWLHIVKLPPKMV